MIVEILTALGLGLSVKRGLILKSELELAKWCKANEDYYNQASEWILSEIAKRGFARVVRSNGQSENIQQYTIFMIDDVTLLKRKGRRDLKKQIRLLEDCRTFIEKRIGA